MGHKKRHHKSRSRSRSPRRHEERSYHRRRDSSSNDSRDGSRRSPDHTSRSRRRSSSPSRSRSKRSRSRDKDYRSRDRRRSRSRERRSRSRERRRSRSRERRRSRSRDRRRSRSRSRSRSRGRSSRHHRSNSRERRRSRSKEKQTSESTSNGHHKEDHNRDLSKEIPGFENMTPAEQIKAKVKLMVEKSKVSQPSSETFVPSPSQLASIDRDGFEQTSFSSTQALGKTQASSGGSLREGSRYDSRAVDPSEYAPRVVELSSTMIEQETPQPSTGKEETIPDEERKSKWLKRLQLLREKHGH